MSPDRTVPVTEITLFRQTRTEATSGMMLANVVEAYLECYLNLVGLDLERMNDCLPNCVSDCIYLAHRDLQCLVVAESGEIFVQHMTQQCVRVRQVL